MGQDSELPKNLEEFPCLLGQFLQEPCSRTVSQLTVSQVSGQILVFAVIFPRHPKEREMKQIRGGQESVKGSVERECRACRLESVYAVGEAHIGKPGPSKTRVGGCGSAAAVKMSQYYSASFHILRTVSTPYKVQGKSCCIEAAYISI